MSALASGRNNFIKNITFFWDITPYILVEIERCFRGINRHHFRSETVHSSAVKIRGGISEKVSKYLPDYTASHDKDGNNNNNRRRRLKFRLPV